MTDLPLEDDGLASFAVSSGFNKNRVVDPTAETAAGEIAQPRFGFDLCLDGIA